MQDQFITPLTRYSANDYFFSDNRQEKTTHIPFADVYRDLMEGVKTTNKIEESAAIAAANGDIDQLHALTIASVKADMALQLFVQLRNKGHDAYSEIMRIGV